MIRPTTPQPIEPDSLHMGDALTMLERLPPAKLVLADPIYDQYGFYVALYRHFIIGRRCVNLCMFTNSLHLAEILHRLGVGARARILSVVQQTGGALSGDLIAKTYHVIWLTTAERHYTVSGKMPDGWVSNTWPREYPTEHRWTKNPQYIGLLLEHLTRPGELVIDPCMGYGLVPWMAKRLGRRYIGIDRDPEAVARALGLMAQCQTRVLHPEEVTDA